MSDQNSIPCDLFVDITGDDCMLPDSKLNDAVAVLSPAQTLMVVSGKQQSHGDVTAFCQSRQLQLIGKGEIDGQNYYLIRLAAA